jgi:MFS family permease
MTIATAWAGNYTHLLVIRILLGIFEAGLFPCITVYGVTYFTENRYLLMTYRREEIGRRMSYIFACSASPMHLIDDRHYQEHLEG